MKHAVALLPVVFLAAVSAAGAEGTLCFDGGPCRPYHCGSAVPAAPVPRRYVATDGSGASFRIGVVAPEESVIPCGNAGSAKLTVNAPKLPRGVAVDLSIRDTRTESTWQWRLGETQIGSPLTIGGPEGEYEALIAADGYVRARRRLTLTRAGAASVMKLEPLPVLSGRIVDDATGAPVAGAMIAADATARAISDAAGRFALRVDPEEWPKSLSVAAAGYAEATVAAPLAHASLALGDTRISRGGAVVVQLVVQPVVQLHQPSPGAVVAVELRRLEARGHRLGAVVKSAAPAGPALESTLRFDGVEPGEYLVLARGHEEWEQAGEPVSVEAARESPAVLRIVPFALSLEAAFEGAPLEHARVVIRNRDMLWSGAVTLDDSGKAAIVLWQGGRLNATVEAAGLAPYLERRTIAGDEDAEWRLDVPTLEIAGRVVNAATGEPVPHAALALATECAEGYSFGLKGDGAADGTFRFAPVCHGRHTLKAAARGFPPSEIAYVFAEPEQTRRLTVKLDPAAPVKLSVIDGRGAPVTGASVMDFSGLQPIGRAVTDTSGVARLMVPEGAVRDVYVFPRNGSFGFIQLTSGTREASLRVADGTSRLVLKAESAAHEPIPDVSVVVRYNGKVLPFEVLRVLERTHGSRATSARDGTITFNLMPPGIYELWPAGSEQELRALAAGTGPAAPVRLAAGAGDSLATLTFAPVEP
ncbi:MAG TPA: carboxypeptidase-like regulatory domain-containing protein [Thermoanaerobaculia bacterium]|nr:carboxypeptidase-like regulatory domain-containing protein [Thermoanaerobaculia bacterium]